MGATAPLAFLRPRPHRNGVLHLGGAAEAPGRACLGVGASASKVRGRCGSQHLPFLKSGPGREPAAHTGKAPRSPPQEAHDQGGSSHRDPQPTGLPRGARWASVPTHKTAKPGRQDSAAPSHSVTLTGPGEPGQRPNRAQCGPLGVPPFPRPARPACPLMSAQDVPCSHLLESMTFWANGQGRGHQGQL